MYFAKQETTYSHLYNGGLKLWSHQTWHFESFIPAELPLIELDKSFVQRSKESLDPVDPDLVAADVLHADVGLY